MLALGSFCTLGLADGLVGTAWPALRGSLRLPIGDLGLVLLAATAGGVVTSVASGRVLRRLGTAPLATLAALLAASGALATAASGSLPALLGAAAPIGAAAGLVDGGLNTVVGVSGRSRLLNLLHAFYGVGTSIGPLVATAAIVLGSWRDAYLSLLAVEVVLGLAWWTSRRRIATGAPRDGGSGEGPGAGGGRGGEGGAGEGGERAGGGEVEGGGPLHLDPGLGRPRLAVASGMVVFFCYVGLEVAAGQWEASFARSALRLSATSAGVAVFGYWAALTAVRFALAARRRPPDAARVVRNGLSIALLAAGGIWWRPDVGLTVLAFVVLGGSLAGVFPALVLLTPMRLGSKRARDVIALQTGAGAVGGPACSALVGAGIAAGGVETLGMALVALAVILLAANALLGRLAPVPVRAGSRSPRGRRAGAG